MKKKTFLILSVLLFSMFFVGSTAMAIPYSLMFDADALGTNKDDEQIYGWDLENTMEDTVDGITVGILTYQSLGGGSDDAVLDDNDTFTESFTLNVGNGVDSSFNALWAGSAGPTGYYNAGYPTTSANLYLDITLSGYITNHDDGGTATDMSNIDTLLDDSYNSVFTTGSARLYVDADGNWDFNAGETIVADLSFYNAGAMEIVDTVFTGSGALVSIGFGFDYINTAYFGTAPGEMDIVDLVNQGWLLTFTQTSIAGLAQEGDISTDPDQYLLGWGGTGMDARFEAIPEPATMFLLGSGLLGLVGIGRKRFFKKN